MHPLIHQKDGHLTGDLLLQPGGFGLGNVPAKSKPDSTTSMVCGYCSTGCSLNVHLKDGEAVSLTPKTENPVNLGMACPKGWEALAVLNSDDRATSPLLRNKHGRLETVDWDVALDTFTQRFKDIQQQYGADSIAFIGTGQLPTEELAFLGALCKFGMGMVHGDGNTRQCMATAVTAYKQSFGFDAPPYTYKDFEESDVIVLIGSNICIAHPIMWQRVMRNPHSPEIIVIDPRTTETAMQATQHLAIAPKSDQALLYGIARILIENEWVDPDYIARHTSDFEHFAEYVKDFTPERIAAESGMTIEQLHKFARTIHEGKRVSFWWTMGVNQSYQGTRTAQAIINLALMTGNIGRPGTGANSITGQCNAMGSRLFSNTTNLLGGHDFTNPEHRSKIAALLNIDADCVPDQNSWAYNEIIDGIAAGKIKGLWVVCTNPAHSWINQNQCAEILDKLEFLVVQDMYHSTETAQIADLVLPAAGWGEKEGTLINSERRFGVIKKVTRAPGLAITDFNIFKLVADRWGCGEMFKEWTSPEAVFQILKRCSAGQPCDITGIEDYRMLDDAGGIQWPFSDKTRTELNPQPTAKLSHGDQTVSSSQLVSGLPDPERRLFEDGHYHHADGRARFIFEEPRPLSEPVCADYPFILMTGRGSAAQWHTQTRTSKSAVLRKLYPETIFAEINPKDAELYGISNNDSMQIKSRRGTIIVQAVLTNSVRSGQLFIAMHYVEANQLTDAVFDPYSRQPSYKACAVQCSKLN